MRRAKRRGLKYARHNIQHPSITKNIAGFFLIFQPMLIGFEIVYSSIVFL